MFYIRFGIHFAVAFFLCSTSLSAQSQSPEEIAREAYDKKEYRLSAEKYVEALDYTSRDASLAYNAACSFALDGQVEKGIEWLRNSILYGFLNVKHIESDSDLNSLRDHAGWSSLVDLAKTKSNLNEKMWGAANFKTDFQYNISVEEKVAGLSKVWAEVKFNFVNFDLVPDLNWDSLYFAYLPKVSATGSTKDYYQTLTELIAQLKDAHTYVRYPNELLRQVNSRPGLRTRLVEGKVLVVAIDDSTLLDKRIFIGQEVVVVGGQEVKEYSDEHVRPYQSASTSQDMDTRTFEYALLSGSSEQDVQLTLLSQNGEEVLVDLPRNGKRKPRHPFVLTMLEGNIAHVELNTFGSPIAAQKFEENFEEISAANGLILDVRNNGGGNSGVGWRILSFLTDTPLTTSAWYTPNYRPAFRAWGRGQSTYGTEAGSFNADGEFHYKKPVIVLTSPRTFSAAEDFAVAFDAMERGLLMGEASGGSTGQPLFFELPGNGSAKVCSKRDYYPGGREFVGVGVMPDIEVRPKIADIRAGRDTVLERALEELRNK